MVETRYRTGVEFGAIRLRVAVTSAWCMLAYSTLFGSSRLNTIQAALTQY